MPHTQIIDIGTESGEAWPVLAGFDASCAAGVRERFRVMVGGDLEHDCAISHMLEELRRNPYIAPSRPEYPNRSGMGIVEEDK